MLTKARSNVCLSFRLICVYLFPPNNLSSPSHLIGSSLVLCCLLPLASLPHLYFSISFGRTDSEWWPRRGYVRTKWEKSPALCPCQPFSRLRERVVGWERWTGEGSGPPSPAKSTHWYKCYATLPLSPHCYAEFDVTSACPYPSNEPHRVQSDVIHSLWHSEPTTAFKVWQGWNIAPLVWNGLSTNKKSLWQQEGTESQAQHRRETEISLSLPLPFLKKKESF